MPTSARVLEGGTGWRATLGVMVAVQMLMVMGVSLSHPLLPLFLEDELGLSRGRELELWAGLLAASNFFTMAIFSPLWGALADRYGRKPMVLRSTAAVGLFNMLVALVTSRYQLLAVRLAMGMLSGYLTTSTALIGSVVPRERLGHALGLLVTGQVLGAVFGPLLGGGISSYFGYRVAFFSTGLLALAAFVLVAVVVRERFVRPSAEELRDRPRLSQGLAGLLRSRDLMPMLVVLMLNRMTVNGVGPVTSLFVRELNVAEDKVPAFAGLAFSVTGLGAALSSPFIGRLADRVGSRPVLISALAASAICYLSQAFVDTGAQFLVLRFAVGVLDGGILPISHVIVGCSGPPGQQSSAYGLMASASSMGSFTGPLLSGLVAATFGLRSVFVYTSAIVAFSAAWVGARVREPVRDSQVSVDTDHGPSS